MPIDAGASTTGPFHFQSPISGQVTLQAEADRYTGGALLLQVEPAVPEQLVLSGASSLELREKSIENEMITLRMSGLQKIRDGVSSIEEVVRETVL